MRNLDRVINKYRIDRMSIGELSRLRETANLRAQSKMLRKTAGARAHYRAVVAACDLYLAFNGA